MYSAYLPKPCFKSDSCYCLPALNTSPEVTIEQNKHVLGAQREGKESNFLLTGLTCPWPFLVTHNFNGIKLNWMACLSFMYCWSTLICIALKKNHFLGPGKWFGFKILVLKHLQTSLFVSILWTENFCFPLSVNTAGWLWLAFNSSADLCKRPLSSLL